MLLYVYSCHCGSRWWNRRPMRVISRRNIIPLITMRESAFEFCSIAVGYAGHFIKYGPGTFLKPTVIIVNTMFSGPLELYIHIIFYIICTLSQNLSRFHAKCFIMSSWMFFIWFWKTSTDYLVHILLRSTMQCKRFVLVSCNSKILWIRYKKPW